MDNEEQENLPVPAEISKTTPESEKQSPRWGLSLKIVVGLVFGLAIAGLFVTFRSILGPLLLAFVLAYLFHPLVSVVVRWTKVSWRIGTTIIFLIVIITLIGLLVGLGVAVAGQFENLVLIIRQFATDTLPTTLNNLSDQKIILGPFEFDLARFNLEFLTEQALSNIQGMLGRLGTVVSQVTTSTLGGLGWLAFILLIAYFILADAGQVPDISNFVSMPGYDYDFRRIGRELGRIWNAYVRGQAIVIIMVMITASMLMTGLGIRYALIIALISGMARLLPYIGPLLTNAILFMVALFQGSNYFNLDPIWFALLAVVVSLVHDQIYDNFVSPRILGGALGVHPAAVLVGALVLSQIIGLVGLVLAAPLLTSAKLIGGYALRKMVDLPPWTEPEEELVAIEYPWKQAFKKLRDKIDQQGNKKQT